MNKLVVGLDEVGRGCLAGPVIAAAVILDDSVKIQGLADSKVLSEKKRQVLSTEIKAGSFAWSIGRAEASEIDEINILQASLLAMKRAYAGLFITADFVKVDGTFYPDIDVPGECIKGGDALVEEISAASILAKVYRDEHMRFLDGFYPGYQFVKHKGYPTAYHKKIIQESGVLLAHRRSFSPVKKFI
ncbi:MAG: ribonuclease HII [Cycloclasticus sp. symbiont of Poecilosclerida sp. M]|nr:MAG: ribonuclease HII [Cycloclasticus sp. symbiont of Poecilosclerida sp. M]